MDLARVILMNVLHRLALGTAEAGNINIAGSANLAETAKHMVVLFEESSCRETVVSLGVRIIFEPDHAKCAVPALLSNPTMRPRESRVGTSRVSTEGCALIQL
ncbi:hypothetical protein ABIC10_007169 [Bradyrhizobium sp. S3.2.12]